ncbi:hypothetical protein BDK51DRAFT_41149 [Blyttiomyces helicus]|uniref:Uncharacterized protein n=1 Tax=Blyttiomyces helicus TaxID=388810 RepID=A0A4P9W647_9FUNG|nr:hypothetical protein BDK51DRAFT_41149 [Blyttiomyces helicus]|eukprot:RKO87919.1 hypothetical protein BDK51DRAFT_41149 [Blyttiomyces helicus]
MDNDPDRLVNTAQQQLHRPNIPSAAALQNRPRPLSLSTNPFLAGAAREAALASPATDSPSPAYDPFRDSLSPPYPAQPPLGTTAAPALGITGLGGVRELARTFDELSVPPAGPAVATPLVQKSGRDLQGTPAVPPTPSAAAFPASPAGANFPGWVSFEAPQPGTAVSPTVPAASLTIPPSSMPQSATAPSPAPSSSSSPWITPTSAVGSPKPPISPNPKPANLAASSLRKAPSISVASLHLINAASHNSLNSSAENSAGSLLTSSSNDAASSPKGSPRRPPRPVPSPRGPTSGTQDWSPPSSLNSPRRLSRSFDGGLNDRRSSALNPPNPFADEFDISRSHHSSEEDLEDSDSEMSRLAAGLGRSKALGHSASLPSLLKDKSGSATLSTGSGKVAPALPARPPKPPQVVAQPPQLPDRPAAFGSLSRAPGPSTAFDSLSRAPGPGTVYESLSHAASSSDPRASTTSEHPVSHVGTPTGVRKPPLPPRPSSPPPDVTPDSSRSMTMPVTDPSPTTAPPLPSRPNMRQYQEISDIPPLDPAPRDRFLTLRPEKVYNPDPIYVNRRPPLAEGLPNSDVLHKGGVRCFAVSGYYCCTGQQNIRIYYIPSAENMRTISVGESKIHAIAFVPTHYMEDEGHHIWVSLDRGELICADIRTGEIVDRRSAHTGTVTHILRYRGQIWTLDENGGLKIWGEDDRWVVSLSQRPRAMRVSARQTAAHIVNDRLWTAAGRTIEVRTPADDSAAPLVHREEVPTAGAITCIASDRDGNNVFTGHEDGKILVWDGSTYRRLRTVAAAVYRITSLLGIGDRHLWAGTSVGKIHVFDLKQCESWGCAKEFGAYHNSALVGEAAGRECVGEGRD